MRFDTGLKVAAVCAVTLASNLILAAEVRMANKSGKARAHQAKRVLTKSVAITGSVVERPREAAPSESAVKQEVGIPVEKKPSSFELKGVRG